MIGGLVGTLAVVAGCSSGPAREPVAVAPRVEQSAAKQAPAAALPAVPQMTKIERFLDGRLPIGFHIYLYNWRQFTDAQAHDLDDAIDDLAKRGFTFLYVGGTTDTPMWARVLARCAERRIAVIPQLDFAYLQQPQAKVEELVAKAVPFIKAYKDSPALMAFSIREEPDEAIMPALQRYYQAILREVPDAPLHLLHSGLSPLVQMAPPYPATMGTDRYGFWWEMSGHRATPWHALNWYHTQLDLYYQQSTRRGADFQAVFTASTLESFATAEQLKASFYGQGAKGPNEAEAREGFYRSLQDHVATGNLGWAKAQDGVLRFWKYYRPPVNCVRAMAWLGIMEGARSLSIWNLAPPREDMKDRGYRMHGDPDKEYITSILGWDGAGTPQFEEFTEANQQIQRYARLIRVMSKDCATQLKDKPLPLGHELVAGTEGAKALVEIPGDDVAWQSFSVPGYAGKVVVVVNTQVGSWCDGRSPRYLAPSDVFRIDDAGNAIDYTPASGPRDLTCRILAKGQECFDLATGRPLPLSQDQRATLTIAPGGGRLLFLAPAGSSEAARLIQAFAIK